VPSSIRSLAPPLLIGDKEESAMAKRRKRAAQPPDPMDLTETAIDAGVRAVEMAAALARGLTRGAVTAARAISEGAAEATDETTRAASAMARDTAGRARRAVPRPLARRRKTASASRPRRAA
jgi:hypothetical protein